MEKCIVCNIKFEKSVSIPNFEDEEKLNEKLSFIYRKILGIFCKYFNLPFKQNVNENKNDSENQEESENFPSFPFCPECRNLVAELCIFHEKLESIHKIIQNTVAKISMKILHSEKEEENYNCLNSDPIENQDENEWNKENGQGQKYRRKIVQNFSPRVVLEKCQNPNPNQNQKSKQTEQTETGKNCVDSQALLDENHYGNDDNNDNNENDLVDIDTFQIDEKKAREKEAKESEHKNSSAAPEKRSQNLMEKIRCGNFIQNLTSAQNSSHSTLNEKSKSKNTDGDSKTKVQTRKKSKSAEKNIVKNPFGFGEFKNVEKGKYLHTSGKWSFEKTEFGWKCGNCPKWYRNPRDTQKHMELWHVPGDFACDRCPRTFCRVSVLKSHRCGFGQEKVMNKSSIEIGPGKYLYNGKWEFTKAADGMFHCSTCSATRKLKDGLAKHICASHDSPDFQCEICARWCKTNHELIKHMKIHSEQKKTFKCPEKDCTFIFMTKGRLRFHQRKKHNAPPQKPILDKKFQCDKCLKKFVFLIYLKRHMVLHEKIFLCVKSQCRERFVTLEEMETHYKKHKLPNQDDSDEEEIGENGEKSETKNPKSREKSTGEKRQWKRGRKKKQESETEPESENEEEIEEIELSEEEEQNEHEEDAELTTEESESETESASKNDDDAPVYTIL